MIHSFFKLLSGLLLTAALPIAHAEIGQISIDEETLSPDLFATAERMTLTSEHRCPPHSDKRVRDRVIEDWLVVKASVERGYELTAMQKNFIDLIDGSSMSWSERFDVDPNLLIVMARTFRSNLGYRVSSEEIQAEYERMIRAKDPLVVDVPVFRATKGEYYLDSKNSRLNYESILEGHKQGKEWSELLPFFAVNGLSEDIITKDSNNWLTLKGMERFGSDAIRSIVGDGRNLKSGDLIGPLPPVYDATSLIYIHEMKIVDTMPLNANLNRDHSMIKTAIKFRVQEKQRSLDLESLLPGHTILEDGQAIMPGGPYDKCP